MCKLLNFLNKNKNVYEHEKKYTILIDVRKLLTKKC